jgi:predicted outer membrane repeat protein
VVAMRSESRTINSVHNAILLLVAVLALPRTAMANPPIIVGLGTADSCTEAALRNALVTAQVERGGTIQFECGELPVTIEVTSTGPAGAITLPNRTTIDGGGLITLSSTSFAEPFVLVDSNTAATIENLALDGKVQNLGRLVVRHVTFEVGDATGRSTFMNSGTAKLVHTRFGHPDYGSGSMASPVDNEGDLTVDRSEFLNVSTADTGAIWNRASATLDVRNSTFSGNYGDVTGGIQNGGSATITGCDFSANGGYDSSAVRSSGSLTIVSSTFADNQIFSGPGGAIAVSGTTVVKRSKFLRNHGYFGGAITNSGALDIEKSTFSANQAAYGGAIDTASAMTVTGSTITGNTARIDGGGIYVTGGVAPTLIKTTVTGNTPNDIVVQP